MHRLALALGRTIKELDATLDPEEFTAWIAYSQLEPFGSPADDRRFRQMYSLYYQVNSKPNSVEPDWLDNDPLETARLKAEYEASRDIDDDIEEFFSSYPGTRAAEDA